jgi:Mg-chelatase subunit ChlD
VVNQGTVKKRWGVKVYALIVSVFVHAAALAVFAAVKLSQSAPLPLQSITTVSISQAVNLAERSSVAPKPRVVPANPVVEGRPIVRAKETAPSNLKSRGPEQIPNPSYQSIPSNAIRREPAELPTANETQTAQAEFFGSTAQGRRICYVVDCSGSMQGLWQRVRGELIESIGRLQPDQYFCVIAFGADSVQESGGGKPFDGAQGRMVRASDRAKKDAYSFVDSLRPAGTTNALAAIRSAVQIRDDTNVGPTVIYFLTDGFELGEQDGAQLAHQIMTMQRSFSPKTQINTIGFWPGEQDRRTLERIAGQSGGEFVVVNDGDISEAVSGRR